VGRRDVQIITTVDEHSSGGDLLRGEWEVGVLPRRGHDVSHHCAPGESDPSLMLGVVVLLVVNAFAIAALVAGFFWIMS
jgi:hypothetical protein